MNQKIHNIRDNSLTEILGIRNLKLLVSEYIPFHRNEMFAFNTKLNAFNDIKKTYITADRDKLPNSTVVETSSIETQVELLSFSLSEYSNFVTEIMYPEEQGIIQKEQIGISISQYGRVICGIDVIEAQGRSDILYLDYIPRLSTDIAFDSSKLLHDLLSEHQRELLNLNYYGRALYRQKYFMILGESMEPNLTAEEYLDKREKESELRQILDYIEKAKDLKNGDKVFIGTAGAILISKDLSYYEPILVQFAFARSVSVFISNYFNLFFSVSDEIKEVKEMTNNFHTDPRAVGKAQETLAAVTAECVLMSELSSFIKNSIKDAFDEYNVHKKHFNEDLSQFSDILEIRETLQSNWERADDIADLIKGLENEVTNLQNQISVIQEKRLQQIFRGIKDTAQIQRRMFKSAERQENKMQILEVIMSGSLAFEILALIVGEYSFSTEETFPRLFGLSLPSGPWGVILWFGINLILWVGLVFLILRTLQWMTKRLDDTLSVFLNFDEKLNMDNFNEWLDSIEMISAETEETEELTRRAIDAEFELDGNIVRASIVYDQKNAYLYNVTLDINKPQVKNQIYYEKIFKAMLKERKVFTNNN
ncbi:MAG: hypothetical protein JW776_07030 [Candidatus Lokiarchaeota archaeon]|nr:hypothetical protein [Candidatus Lokiarchaeota archaeon]